MNEYGKQVKKQMDSYANDPDSVDEEIFDIQNAQKGVEVRGSLASGVKKSFDKADWAGSVAEQILDESFDDGVLNTAIEQKLNDLETEYAPELTNIKNEVEDARGNESTLGNRLDGVSSQLAQTVDDIESLNNEKADKTALTTINQNLQDGLNAKVGKGENESVSWGMLDQEAKENVSGDKVAIVGDNSVNTSNIVDGATTFDKRSRLGEPCTILLMGDYPNIDTSTGTITFPSDFRVVNGKNYISMPAGTTVDFSDALTLTQIMFFLNTETKTITRVGASGLNTLDESNILFCTLSNVPDFGIRDVNIGCPYSINGFKPQNYREKFLMMDSIPKTKKEVTFHLKGQVQNVFHRNLEDVLIRTDTFSYTENTITETRALEGLGTNVTFVYHLDTLETEVL